jgi:hypothetical protein
LRGFDRSPALAGAKPRAEAVDLSRRRIGCGEMRQSLFHGFDPVSRDSPIQARAPNRNIVRPVLEAWIKVSLCVVVIPHAGGEVRSSQPDAIILGGSLGGDVEESADILDRVGPESKHEVALELEDGLLRRPFADRVQVFPPGLDDPLGFPVAAELAIRRHEHGAELGAVVSRIVGGFADHSLGVGELGPR